MADSDHNELDKDLRDEFIVEIKEDLEQLESDLLTMEDNTLKTKDEVINRAFRAIHSIKGGAGFCGLKELGSLSHSIENVLMRIRDKKILISPDIIDALFAGLDKIKLMVENIDSEKTIAYDNEKQKLEKIISFDSYLSEAGIETCSENSDTGIAVHPENYQNTGDVKSDDSENLDPDAENGCLMLNNKKILVNGAELRRAIDEGKFVYSVLIDGEKDILGRKRTASDMTKDIEDSSDILFTDLSPDLHKPELKGKIFNLVLATILDIEFLSEVLEINPKQIVILDYDDFDFSNKGHKADLNLSPDQPGKSDALTQNGNKVTGNEIFHTKSLKTKNTDNTPKAVNASEPDENIRIKTSLVAKLMNLAGELVLTRNQLHPILEDYFKQKKSDTMAMQNLDRVTSAMQEYIMQMRMQPVGKIFGRFQRIVRDTAKKLSKKINYVIEGGEVELDRTILEGLSNPLIHLLRNCIDHGIESPEARIKAEKPETGTIRVKAVHLGGHVYINIQDDGKGMNPDEIALSAVEKGIITKETYNVMTDREKINIIFMPGFSTSDKITDISGRGVGMDVVKTNINRLRGNIKVESSPGKGTDIELIIPLTLAIVSALIVGTGNCRFAIPQLNISEIIFINPGEMYHFVEKLGNSEVILIRDELLPVVRLRTLLNIDSVYRNTENKNIFYNSNETTLEGSQERSPDRYIERRKALADRRNTKNNLQQTERRLSGKDRRKNKWDGNYIVVLKMGVKKFGLCVETLFDNEEIVVEPLSDYIKDCEWFSGSTTLGDGRIIMVLDVSGMANQAHLQFEVVDHENRIRLAEKSELEKNAPNNRSMIIFSSRKNEYFALPLDKLSRLEVIAQCDILKTGDYKFMNYKGTVLPLFYLEDFFPPASAASGALEHTETGSEEIYVLIPKGLSSGIIVSCIIDTMEIPVNIQQNDKLPRGIHGTMIIDNKAIQLLDDKIIFQFMKKHNGLNKNTKENSGV